MSLTDRYRFRTIYSLEDGEHVGLCDDFPSLSWLAATEEDARMGIEGLVYETLDDIASEVLR